MSVAKVHTFCGAEVNAECCMCCREDTGVDKPLLSRKEAAGHSKACEAGLVGVLTALSRATEALPPVPAGNLCRCASQMEDSSMHIHSAQRRSCSVPVVNRRLHG